MNDAVVAVPSVMPGGLDVSLGEHFGHCDVYTLIKVENGKICAVKTLPNVPHQQGGCMAPVNHLAQNGVTALIAGGMGFRPLMGFKQAGIDVYYGLGSPSVLAAVEALLEGRLDKFSAENTCGGH